MTREGCGVLRLNHVVLGQVPLRRNGITLLNRSLVFFDYIVDVMPEDVGEAFRAAEREYILRVLAEVDAKGILVIV